MNKGNESLLNIQVCHSHVPGTKGIWLWNWGLDRLPWTHSLWKFDLSPFQVHLAGQAVLSYVACCMTYSWDLLKRLGKCVNYLMHWSVCICICNGRSYRIADSQFWWYRYGAFFYVKELLVTSVQVRITNKKLCKPNNKYFWLYYLNVKFQFGNNSNNCRSSSSSSYTDWPSHLVILTSSVHRSRCICIK